MTDNKISIISYIRIICLDPVISHVLNLTMGPTPIKVKSEDISPEGMTFILNRLDCHYVGSTVEFSTYLTREACNRHNNRSRALQGDRKFLMRPISVKNINQFNQLSCLISSLEVHS
eukprot:TRINITY_DN5161_c0_g1_i11.p1 TRINITY_DN5161_c0_g1~~TRINITY_DN5161_c0_g1_i11.p1  ORF type:complete len:117 (+),score=0.84 TRINITY_DN5161_c0_g1_i11:778-1128(+)